MLLGTLGASLLENYKAQLQQVNAQLEQARILIPPHPLTNFEIQQHYQNKPKFNGVYSRNNLPKITNWAYVINLEEFKSVVII